MTNYLLYEKFTKLNRQEEDWGLLRIGIRLAIITVSKVPGEPLLEVEGVLGGVAEEC